MGIIRNKMIIVHHYNFEEISDMRIDAIEYFSNCLKEQDYNNYNEVAEKMISDVLKSPLNSDYAFVIMGDCSKVGRKEEEIFDKYRRKWAKKASEKMNDVAIADIGEAWESEIEDIF